ncbi:MAG: metabolite traffic protein EboE [Planctomycetaceae bacterium]|nr:metabolite traffic protein EboE [Planctomycetaceae bacterium]
MSISTLPLSYCCNVHPSSTTEELLQILSEKTAHVQELTNQPIAAGLWLADTVTRELTQSAASLESLKEKLSQLQLPCYTLNAFPYGNFHTERVKEQVYLPDWASTDRLDYTVRCAKLLAEILPEGVEGSISTVPLGFKELCTDSDFMTRSCDQLIELARQLDQLHDQTGRVIRLAIEPEPLCVIETTAEAVSFFEQLRQRAQSVQAEQVVNTHLGLCYDICHQAVEYEDVSESIQTLESNEIRINKVHITCAIELRNPASNVEGREFLAQFAEPRYLHQTFTKLTTGSSDSGIQHTTDLTPEFALSPPQNWLDAPSWRIHFHVPVHADSMGPLGTTRASLIQAMQSVKQLSYAPHLEVETYTWNVMPGETPTDVCQGLAEEMRSTYKLLQQL